MAQRKPRSVFNGTDRQRLNKLRNAMFLINGMDSRTLERLNANGTGMLFVVDQAMQKHWEAVQDRLTACLGMKS